MNQSNEQDVLTFSSMLASKLCHDLLSPVSALLNAVELLDEADQDPAIVETAQELLQDSAKQTARKLTFYRLAFGAAGGAQRLDASTIKQAASDYMQDQRADLVWKCSVPDMALPQAKILLNLLALTSHCLPRGGELTASIGEEGVGLNASGPRLIVPDQLKDLINGNVQADNAREVMAGLCAKLLASENGKASISHNDEELIVQIAWA